MTFPDPHPKSRSLKGGIPDLFPPKVVWSREMGWLNVRDPWGEWHSIEAKDAPRNWVKLAMQAKAKPS